MKTKLNYTIGFDIRASLSIDIMGKVSGTVSMDDETMPDIRIAANDKPTGNVVNFDKPNASMVIPEVRVEFAGMKAFDRLARESMRLANMCFNRFALFKVEPESIQSALAKGIFAAKKDSAHLQDLALDLALAKGLMSAPLLKECLIMINKEIIKSHEMVSDDFIDVVISAANRVGMEHLGSTGPSQRRLYLMDFLEGLV